MKVHEEVKGRHNFIGFLLVKFKCKNMKKTEMEGTGTTTIREQSESFFVFIKPAAAPELRQTFHHNKHVL